MWGAAQRFIAQEDSRESMTIIHLGDHDPSGIDMTRDIQERLEMFGANVEVKRVALTMKQIEAFNPPPNPTKVTDARSGGYISRFGHECWELDALEPKVITQLIEDEVTALIDYDLFNAIAAQENRDKANIQLICDRYDEVVDYLKDA
jgi:hypothetical protein